MESKFSQIIRFYRVKKNPALFNLHEVQFILLSFFLSKTNPYFIDKLLNLHRKWSWKNITIFSLFYFYYCIYAGKLFYNLQFIFYFIILLGKYFDCIYAKRLFYYLQFILYFIFLICEIFWLHLRYRMIL